MRKIAKYRHPALILGMAANGLGVARSLGRKGIRVYGMDIEEEKRSNRIAFASRFCEKISIPSSVEKDGIAEFLLSALDGFIETPVLLSTSDFFAKITAKHFGELKRKCLTYRQTGEWNGDATDKELQIEHAMRMGIPVPRTLFLSSAEELSFSAPEIPYPAILKGTDSTEWAGYLKRGKGLVVESPRDLPYAIERAKNFPGKIMVQEVIPGGDVNLYEYCILMNRQKERVASFSVQKIRQYPCRFGVGTVVVSRFNGDIEEMGATYFRTMGFSGIGQIEFKYDERDRLYKFIEMNPRIWLQNSLADRCGINFPLLAYDDLVGNRTETTSRFDEDVKWIDFRTDCRSFREYKKEGSIGWGEWVRSLGGRKVFSIFSADDPVPFFKSFLFDIKVLK